MTSDQLTALGLGAQIGAGVFYGLARYNRYALLLVILCLVLNWLGDSLDGTLARVRQQQRPRYGFYVDHMVDIFGAIALMCGLGFSGFLHWQTAIAMLVAFLLLSGAPEISGYTQTGISRAGIFRGVTPGISGHENSLATPPAQKTLLTHKEGWGTGKRIDRESFSPNQHLSNLP